MSEQDLEYLPLPNVDVFDDAPGGGAAGAAGLLGSPPTARAGGSPGFGAGLVAMHVSSASGAFAVHQSQERPAFYHSQHRDVDCAACHATEPVHGAVTVTTVTDCRSCHHTQPLAGDCVSCHAEPGGTGAAMQVSRTLSLSVGDRPDRQLPFDHDVHASEDCSACHAEGLERSAARSDCASCHQPHHEATADCAACHVPAAPGAHRIETAHVGGCAGSGCHQDVPFEQVERTRMVCLACHQDQRDHRPEGDCAECHAMLGPPFTGAAP